MASFAAARPGRLQYVAKTSDSYSDVALVNPFIALNNNSYQNNKKRIGHQLRVEIKGFRLL